MNTKHEADLGHGAKSARDAAPPRLKPVRTNPGWVDFGRTAGDSFDGLLRFYVCAVADNLHCTLSAPDPEGPHQFRVSLRRLRAALLVFRPVLRRKLRKRLARAARNLGRIVSDLRDADVMTGEMIRPAPGDSPREAAVIAALEAWREEMWQRARTDLRSAHAVELVSELRRHGELGDWRPQGERKCIRLAEPAAALTGPAMDAAWARAASRGGRLARLSQAERHELRKDLKTLRYTAEIAAAANPGPGSKPFLAALKRLQGSLGCLNDLATFERFDPPMPDTATAQAFKSLHRRLTARHVNCAQTTLAEAEQHWKALAEAERFWM